MASPSRTLGISSTAPGSSIWLYLSAALDVLTFLGSGTPQNPEYKCVDAVSEAGEEMPPLNLLLNYPEMVSVSCH